MTLGLALLAGALALQVREKSAFALIAALMMAGALLLWHRPVTPLLSGFSPAGVGVAYCTATLVVMFSGMPIAFALGVVATAFMILFMPRASVDTIAQNVYEELANVIILALPLFILKGAAIGRSDAGRDLYAALHAWLHRIPGGLGIANTSGLRSLRGDGRIVARDLLSNRFCGHPGDAQARLFLRPRGRDHCRGRNARHSPAAVRHHAAVCCCRRSFAGQAVSCRYRAGVASYRAVFGLLSFPLPPRAQSSPERRARGGRPTAILDEHTYTMRDKLLMLAWVTPFVTILAGVMIVLYAGSRRRRKLRASARSSRSS